MKIKLLLSTIVSLGFILSGSAAVIATANDGPWSAGATWTGGVLPGNTDDAVINHDVTLDMNDRIRNITITAGNTLTNGGFNLRVDTDWTNDGNYVRHASAGKVFFRRNVVHNLNGVTHFRNLQINMNSILLVNDSAYVHNQLLLTSGLITALNTGDIILVADATSNGRMGKSNAGNILGDFTYMRNVNRANDWSIYGMPFDASLDAYASTTNGNMIYSGFTGGANYPSFSWVNTYFYNEAANAGDFNNGYVVPSSTADVVARGSGFWYYNTDTPFGGGTTVYDQNWIWTMRGTVDIATPFDFGVTYNSATFIPFDNEAGWNLVANPYPGTMNWDEASWTKNNMNDAVHYFRTSNQMPATYIGGVGVNGGNKNIPAGQGFWVQANDVGAQLIAPQTVISGSGIALRDEESIQNVLRMDLEGDEVAIRLHEDATEGFDPQIDAQKFTAGGANIYTMFGTDETIYAINALPLNVTSVPLYTATEGEFTITGLESFNGLYDIKIEDVETGILTDITEDYTINYTPSVPGEFENRFVIHFTESVSTAAIEEVNTTIGSVDFTYLNETINASYNLPGNEKATYNVISIDGKTLSTGTLTGETGTLNLKRSNAIRLLEVDYKGNKLTYKIL